MSYICTNCGEIFEEPERVTFCYEDYYGVGSMFPNKNYGTMFICPNCGSEDVDDYCEFDEDGEEIEDEF